MANSIGLRKPSISPMLPSAKAGIEAVDRLGQHRVTEAIDDMRELGDDRRVERDVIAVRNQEHVDVRLDLAGKLFEHEMLILHLGAELGRLEQAFAIPVQRVSKAASRACVGGHRAICAAVSRNVEPLVDEGDVASSASVTAWCAPCSRLCSEWNTWWTAVRPMFSLPRPSPVMKCGVEQLVVVFGVAVARVAKADFGVAVGDLANRHGGVGDVVQEGVSGADCQVGHLGKTIGVACVIRSDLNQCQRGAGCARSQRLRRPAMTTCGKPRRGIRNEVPVWIGRQQRQVADMIVGQVDAEDIARLSLDLAPGRQPAVGAVEQRAGCIWLAVAPSTYSRRNTWCDGCEV